MVNGLPFELDGLLVPGDLFQGTNEVVPVDDDVHRSRVGDRDGAEVAVLDFGDGRPSNDGAVVRVVNLRDGSGERLYLPSEPGSKKRVWWASMRVSEVTTKASETASMTKIWWLWAS